MKFKKTAMSTALEEMLAFPEEQVEPLTEEEVQVFEDTEGDELVEGINVAVEAIEQLECLIATMESAKVDPNFGKYNLPVYQNSLESICKSLGVKLTTVSQEAFGDDTVLSTEGLKDMASKVIETIKALVARFVTWFKNTYTSKNAVMLKMAKGHVSSLSKLNAANWNAKAPTMVPSKMFCGLYYHYGSGHFKDLDHITSLVFKNIPVLDKTIGELSAATKTMDGLISGNKEDYNEVVETLLTRFVDTFGPKARYHEYSEMMKNEDDDRHVTERNTIVLDSVGEFSAMERICKEFVSKGFHLHNGVVDDICGTLLKLCGKLRGLEQKGTVIPPGIYKSIREAANGASNLCTARFETLWQTNRLIGVAMRAGVGDKPFTENVPYSKLGRHVAGYNTAGEPFNQHQQTHQQNNDHYFQQQQMNNF